MRKILFFMLSTVGITAFAVPSFEKITFNGSTTMEDAVNDAIAAAGYRNDGNPNKDIMIYTPTGSGDGEKG